MWTTMLQIGPWRPNRSDSLSKKTALVARFKSREETPKEGIYSHE
jgi:hypothetical protein